MTASKAIIEKEYQPRVIVSTKDPNPFNTLTDQDLEEYRREVELKHKGPAGECSWRGPGARKVRHGQVRRWAPLYSRCLDKDTVPQYTLLPSSLG